MAAPKKTVPAAPKTPIVKSEVIRDWFTKNPEGTATACSKALKEQGVEVGSGHCQQILTKLKGGSSPASAKVDVGQIKQAAEFVKSHGDVDEAISAIDQVGEFIKTCGSPQKAKSALEAYKVMAEAFA